MSFIISNRMRANIFRVIKEKKNNQKWEKLIGYPVLELMKHLEKQFKDGMNWENYGEWHIDHIIPCSVFDLENSEEQDICFHHTNLQPLWANDNISKSNRILFDLL